MGRGRVEEGERLGVEDRLFQRERERGAKERERERGERGGEKGILRKREGGRGRGREREEEREREGKREGERRRETKDLELKHFELPCLRTAIR
eukprot:1220190-Rhodomonas_salina.3